MAITPPLQSQPQHAVARDPRLLGLKSAAMEIRQACDELGAEAHRSPFFFVVGAGISFPPVPLAASIIGHCQELAKQYGRAEPPAGDQTLDEYSHWFSRAYPGARQRQEYLRRLIERKPLSVSSLRLAHLLSAHKLTNLVVTTNFDDFIARALRLFGEEPAVCDHPRTVGRIDRERPDIQIVHVHGSYLFYDCANLRGEVTDRARADDETSFTMVGLLDSLLWTRSPLVIGYSGWEGDVIMSALKRRLRGGNPLAQSVYWFCYRRTERDRLPSWLRDSPDVRFVVPEEPTPQPTMALRAAAEERGGARGAEAPPEPSLPAIAVFDQLNRVFDIGTPALFENPIEYFARSLQAALPDAEDPGGDPYSFKRLIEQLHEAAQSFEKRKRPTRGLEADLDRLRALMRESQYADAVALLAKLIPARLKRLEASEQREVLAAANLAGSALFSKLADEPPTPDLANALVFDPRLAKSLGELPRGTAWVVGSRWGQYGTETVIGGKSHGTFTYHLTDTLRDPDSDVDGSGVISLLEATVEAGRRILRGGNRQTPVVAGDAAEVGLFLARKASLGTSAPGNLHALLVGVAKHRMPNIELSGPAHDVARFAKTLGARNLRFFQKVEVKTLLDARSTRAALDRALADVVRRARPQDTLLFYFSGHASRREAAKKPDGIDEILLVLYDYDGESGGVMTHHELLKALAPTKAARCVVILDL